jgi:D-alanyl-D-alanine carboxypeptidase
MARWIAWCTGGLLFALLTGALFVHRAAVEERVMHVQLAALSQLEMNAAREWRAQFGFKRDLGTGARGSDVVLLQKTLAAQNFLDLKNVTGVYGSFTKKGVQSLQRLLSLPPTGEVDGATRERLNQLYRGMACPRPEAAYPDLALASVGKGNLLPYEYAPSDLVDVAERGTWTNGVICLRRGTAEALARMIEGAAKEGHKLGVTSGFRTADVQKALYDYWHAVEGDAADMAIAPPGGSEHQLGTVVDLTGASVGYEGTRSDFGKAPEGRWLAAHAAKYGFAQSFPRGKESVTGYVHEPWHWRYVGKETAATIAAGGGGTAEYLAAHAGEFPRLRGIPAGFDLTAAAALAVYVPREGAPVTLLQKDADTAHAIASVTKLLTALVAEKVFPAGTLIPISATAAHEAVKEGQSRLAAGDAFSLEDMLTLLLVESSNPAARGLADAYGYARFMELMRAEVARLGLSSVTITDPTGLDPVAGPLNTASARDLAALLREVLDNHSALRARLGTASATVRSTGGVAYKVTTTDELLNSAAWPEGVLGGKTGETPRAKQALVFAVASPSGEGYIEGVLLESNARFGEAEKILHWLRASYEWGE